MRPRSFRPDRRIFLGGMAAALAGPGMSAAEPFIRRRNVPLGIQLYMLGPDVAKDLDGVLTAVAGIGYRTVELAGFLGRTPEQMRAALDRAGLAAPSAHVQSRGDSGFDGDLAKLADALRTVGVRTAVMPMPYIPERFGSRPAGEDGGGYTRRVLSQMTADDWKMNADFLNEKAAVLKRSGLKVGYHNHNFEFAPLGATNALEILLERTDPALVTFELDVGWAAAAGADPFALLARHRGRFTLMHVKDVKASTQPNFALKQDATEVGAGIVDWPRLLPAAYDAGVRGFFVEQEPPFAGSRLESAKISFDYLAKLEG